MADPEKKKTAPEMGQQQNSGPETGAEPAQEPNARSVEPGAEPVKPEGSGEDKPFEPDDAAKWKAMSRKNEDNAKANLRRAEHAETERDSLRTENARLKVRMQYPQINDDALSLCSETEPEKIQEWADKYAKLNPLDTEPVKRDVREDALARKVSTLAEHPQGQVNPKAAKGDVYRRHMKRQQDARRKKN